MFLASRSSVDILQFRDIIHTSQGISITNKRPDQLENEVLLFWAAIIPVVGNPIIYLFCVTEYRQNIINMWRVCTQEEKKTLMMKTISFTFLLKKIKRLIWEKLKQE